VRLAYQFSVVGRIYGKKDKFNYEVRNDGKMETPVEFDDIFFVLYAMLLKSYYAARQ